MPQALAFRSKGSSIVYLLSRKDLVLKPRYNVLDGVGKLIVRALRWNSYFILFISEPVCLQLEGSKSNVLRACALRTCTLSPVRRPPEARWPRLPLDLLRIFRCKESSRKVFTIFEAKRGGESLGLVVSGTFDADIGSWFCANYLNVQHVRRASWIACRLQVSFTPPNDHLKST